MANILFYELNEVPIKLFEFYAKSFPNSSFAYLLNRSNLYETHAADIGDLSPWISWPTLHRGVSNIDHGISDLGQDLSRIDNTFPPIWQILANAGIKVGMFGSLQSYPLPIDAESYAFYIPDTFAASPDTYPASLNSFQSFNLSMTQANGRNVVSKVPKKEAMRFVLNAPFMGLTATTTLNLLYQLGAEKFDRARIVRRRSSQAEIAFDLYFALLKKTNPNISFFFTNHLASSMHRYWPTIFPEDYHKNSFDEEWIRTWQNEIPHSVKIANAHLKRLISYANSTKTRLVVASSMGQGAVDGAELINNQVLIHDISKLLSFCGINKNDWEPRLAMAPRVVVRPKSQDFFTQLEKLQNISVCGSKINVEIHSTGDVRFDIFLFNVNTLEAYYKSQKLDPNQLGIRRVDLQDASGSNAYHIPEGLLIDYNPTSRGSLPNLIWEKLSVLEVAPSLLRYFGIPSRAYMQTDCGLFKN